ncbi:TetR family transcriptional regulator C-terminal domain-containing protein [Hyphomicrobium sp. MC1]|uniref:TetR family transcriptional regulator C-terminal domain-containing protein n=1 Tax=Hyphomicrobium sp. (strain MC1) TaxID=717785 RepID=UPI000213EDA3|nr:TetR family transcriptional regulator C-terminal domain-containing protein [Hyphomicrobium sp. MC1]CCB66659.1 putative HTH-type transcriptional regulator BetI [Hyphomicrobium sp. MC1]
MAKVKDKDLRRERGESTRRILIDAAVVSVAQNGLAGTTLNSVAGIANVSRALVGFHFESKDQLLMAAIASSIDIYDASLRAAQERADPEPIAQLWATVQHDVGFGAKHGDILSLWCAAWGEARGLDLYRVVGLPSDHKYKEEIADAIYTITGDRAEAMRRAAGINALIFGVWLECHLDPEGFKVQRALEAAKAIIHPLIASQQPSPA